MANAREYILSAAMSGVRQYGLDGVTIQNISALAGLSQGALYRYFASKDELMLECFYRVDRQIAQIFDRITLTPEEVRDDPLSAVRKLWLPYFRFLTSHPDETVFYHRYRDAPGFTKFNKHRDISYFASFIKMVDMFQTTFPRLKRIPPRLLWLHVLTCTVLYAKYVVEGVLKPTERTEEDIFQLMMSGLSAQFNLTSPDDKSSNLQSQAHK